MSEMDQEELNATKMIYGCITAIDLINQWKQEYDIPVLETDFVIRYIEKLEGKNEQQ